MNEQDKFWVEKCKADGRYIIMVDNDDIYVWDFENDREAYSFTSYGYRFAKELLEYIGCQCEYV